MSNFEELEKRYFHDPAFHQLVDVIFHCMYEVHLTPSEVREAAMMACFKFEMKHPGMKLRLGVTDSYE